MTRVDVNGNTVSKNEVTCLRLIRQLPTGATYRTDAHRRIMVDLPDGGYIVFFEQDRPRLANRVKERLTHAK